MKAISYFATTALAAGGLLLLGAVAGQAQTVVSPTGSTPADLDLIAAFYVPDGANTGSDTGGGFSYEVDLGTLASLGSGASFNLNADLTSIYGSGFSSASRADGLFWTVFGVNNLEFYTTDTGTGLLEKTSGYIDNPAQNYMEGLYGDLGGSNYISGSDTHAADINNSSDPNDFAGTFEGILGTPIWGYSSAWGSGQATINADNSAQIGFYDVATVASGSHAAPEVGTFSLASDGDLTYTAAVPEPSTWASIIVGAVGLLAFRRRRVA